MRVDEIERLDERLMAYADGELRGADATEVEALLARSAEARERLRIHLETAALARAAFAGTLDEPVPERLLAPLGRTGDCVLPFPRRRHPWRRTVTALAASVALLLALGAAWWWPADEPTRLARVLETVPSGERAGAIVPLSTVRTADGRLCRRFLEEGRGEGLACRTVDGDWRVTAWIERPTDDYAPAGGDARGPLELLLERWQARVLSPAEERRVLAR